MVDVRYISSAGYQLWPCASGTTASGIIIEYIPVPVCEPDIVTDEQGTLHTVGQEDGITTPVISTKDYKPNLKTS